MYFHIILTEKCNSQCRYCYEKSLNDFENGLEKKFNFDFSAPSESNIDLKHLKKFFEKGGIKKPKIIFYGGEPLLKINKIKEIIDFFPNADFFMQTNGKLLNLIQEDYLNKLKRILVSIDGTEQRTDYNRGKGTYKRVISNIKHAREKGFNGEIVARMTLSEFPDIFEQALHLIELINQGLFDSIHWQLDAGFYKNDFNKENFSKFVKEYNDSLSKLINYWVKNMQKGVVFKIYPFLGIFESLYYNKKTKLRCGSGYMNYTITTDSNITCCPIMNNIKDFYVGNIRESSPKNLKQVFVSEPCSSCSYLDICGGRCLYSNKTKLWPKQGQELICNTIIHLIKKIENKLPEIKELINKNVINEKSFYYEKYFGPEIIP